MCNMKLNVLKIKNIYKSLPLSILITLIIAGIIYYAIISHIIGNISEKVGYVERFDKTENGNFFALFYGKIRHSSGREDLLFRIKIDYKMTSEWGYFPTRFFAWGIEQVAYCSANLKKLILVDYKSKKEVYCKQMPEEIEYISVNKERNVFVIATQKGLYLLKSQPASKNKESSANNSFILKQVAKGSFCWPVLSPDGRYIACGENDNKENELATSLVVIDLNKNIKKKLLSERFGDLPINNVYRIIYSIAWSRDSRYVAISTTTPADPACIWVSVADVLTGKITEFTKNTGLCNPPGCFTSEDKFIFSQGEPQYKGFGDYSTIKEPFRAKLVFLDFKRGNLEFIEEISKDLNAYWPIYVNREVYFLDKNSFLTSEGCTIYKLKGKTVKRLFKVNGDLVNYDVIKN